MQKMASKGQGLPLSFIVIAAISALVLILVIAFTIGGLGGFFKQINIAGGTEDLSTVQTACSASCSKTQFVSSKVQFQSSDYCKKTYTIDLNKDGKITATNPQETKLQCYSTAINIECTVQLGTDVLTGVLNCTK